ncbi:unnamed protein product [Linum tenue]|uniref:TTF-type domain-containing protein n=1 Tax=Linum tenue TaxID=586396 RepID=A0AAV0QWT3_9ROSI|nr:unnamed protein product [Linum tenue]
MQDEIRRAYLIKGPCQPKGSFPYTDYSGEKRRFNPSWYTGHKGWLEYSVHDDAVYCLPCYLFVSESKNGSGEAFISNGVRCWNRKTRLDDHVGGPNSSHNVAAKKGEDLLRQSQSISSALVRQTDKQKREYRIRLQASVTTTKALLHQGLPFRGHDESESSENKGNFRYFLEVIANENKEVRSVVLENAPKNLQLTSPKIQKDIVRAIASLISQEIIKDLGDSFFCILVDESRDVSIKEQMVLVIRYVDKNGCVIERFLGIAHVADTRAATLKKEIESILGLHGLSLAKVRGQGYDGASNMRGEINGLKSLILVENPSAHYIHCFAHQLQLTLVAVARDHVLNNRFFEHFASLLNVIGGSPKRVDSLRDKHAARVIEALSIGDLESGQGLNQQIGLKRPGDTRWGSHLGALTNLMDMFSSVVDVLNEMQFDTRSKEAQGKVVNSLLQMQTFEFVFHMKMMIEVLAITNELSIALQRKDQDLVNAMELINCSKKRLQELRDEGWEPLFDDVVSFCTKEQIHVPNMNDLFTLAGRTRRSTPHQPTNLHYYQVDLFYAVIDLQLQELNTRFGEVNTRLLDCISCFSPANSFASFDKAKLMSLTEFYPEEFPSNVLSRLHQQLGGYISHVKEDKSFDGLRGIDELARKLVERGKDTLYPLVYLLLKLVLTLPVATASCERAFSAMKIIKNDLRNRLSDQFMNDCLVVYIEKDLLCSISDECILETFQQMKSRRGSL